MRFSFEVNSGCTGSAASPTAPPGVVCLYTASIWNVDNGSRQGAEPAALQDRAFQVRWTATGNATADTILEVSWAYTAP